MPRLRPILKALSLDRARDRGSRGRFRGSNLFPVLAALLLAQPLAATFLLAAIGLPMLVNMALNARPEDERLELLPLEPYERRGLRFLSQAGDPLTWVPLALIFIGGRRALSVTIGIAALLFLVRSLAAHLPRRPALPAFAHPLAALMPASMWQFARTLDFHAALLLAAIGLHHRLGGAQPSALLAAGLLITLAFSTPTQALLDLDGPGGMERLRMLPLRGWQVLLAKDLSWLLLLLPLVLPLAPAPAIAGALALLASGHLPSVRSAAPQPSGSFVSGANLFHSLVQLTALALAGALTHTFGAWMMLPFALAAAVTLGWAGRELEESPR